VAKSEVTYTCSACQAASLRWVGRCPKCKEFGSMVEAPRATSSPGVRTKSAAPRRTAQPVGSLASARAERTTTGLGEFDRCLGGGLVAGQVVLVAGEPGVGKSTLVLAVAHSVASSQSAPVLYVTGEESADQIGIRATRIGAIHENLLVADETNVANAIGHIDALKPALVIVDSVQTMASANVDGRPGGVAQVLEVTQALTRTAKERGVPVLLVGQSTRENTVAGPRALEHLVDTVLTFEGDRATSLRLLRATKNRYGPADEVVAYEQTESGLREVVDPSELFRGQRDSPVAGTCVTVTMEGRRALIAEIQVLLGTSQNYRHIVTGIDTTRVATLAAVTDRFATTKLSGRDLFVATVGGARIGDPGADLAICLAIASGLRDTAVPANVIAIGEVALSGDIRPVPNLAARVSEAVRLGYRRILVPKGSRERIPAHSNALYELAHLKAAVERLEELS